MTMSLTQSRLLATQKAFVFQESRVGDFVAMPSEIDTRGKKRGVHRQCGWIVKKTDGFVAIAVDGDDKIVKVSSDSSSLSFDLPRICMRVAETTSKHVLKRPTSGKEETVYVVETRSDETTDGYHIVIRDKEHVALAVLDAEIAFPIATRAMLISLRRGDASEKKYVFLSSVHGITLLRHKKTLKPLSEKNVSVDDETGYLFRAGSGKTKRLSFDVLHGVDAPIDADAQMSIMEKLE